MRYRYRQSVRKLDVRFDVAVRDVGHNAQGRGPAAEGRISFDGKVDARPIGNAQPSPRAEIHHDTGIPTPGPIVGGEFKDTFGSRRSASNDCPNTGCERHSAVAHCLGKFRVEVDRPHFRLDGLEAPDPIRIPLSFQAERRVDAYAEPPCRRQHLPGEVRIWYNRPVTCVTAVAPGNMAEVTVRTKWARARPHTSADVWRARPVVAEPGRRLDEMQRANDLPARDAGQASGIEIDCTRVFRRGRLSSVSVPEPACILLHQLKAGGACASGRHAEQRTDHADEQSSPQTVLRHLASPPLCVLLLEWAPGCLALDRSIAGERKSWGMTSSAWDAGAAWVSRDVGLWETDAVGSADVDARAEG